MPDWSRDVRPRLSSLRLSPTRESEIVEELSQHLDDRWRELMAGGASPEEARELALAEFRGDDVLAKYMAPLRQAHPPFPITPGVPSAHVLGDLSQDLRYAGRMLRKRPGFTAVAILTLAVGIGASTVIFSVVYGVLLKPLPFHEPDRLVGVSHSAPGVNQAVVDQGPATYFTYRDNNRVFEDIGAWDSAQVTITKRGDPERVDALMVTDATLPLLGVPVRGRLFTKEDDEPGRPPRALLSYSYWQRKFGGADDIVGQLLDVNGIPREIVGVLPASFKFLRTDPAVLLPMQLNRANVWVVFSFQAVARLKPGVTLSEANADVARMIPHLVDWVPGFKEWRLEPNVHPLADDLIGDVRRILWIVLATVGMVLLIACANVANLFLVRAEGRQNELAVRAALGASRGRMARQLLSESLILALVAGVVGLMFARAGIELVRILAPSTLPRVDEVGIDPMVLLFTFAVSVMTSVVISVTPIVRFGTPSTTALKEGGRAASDSARRHRTRNALVVGEVALAFVLLIVSGLMIRTFVALQNVDPGFVRPEEVQTFRIALPGPLVRDPREVARLHAQIAERLQSVPGVASVGLSSSLTMDGDTNGNPTIVENVPVTRGESPPLRRFKYIGPGYIETMGNRLLAGRHISWADVHQARPVVVISQNLAREYWRNPSEALGKRITNSPGLPWREVVGVVGNEHDDGLNQPATPIVYWPMLIEQFGDGPLSVSRTMAYVVRSNRVGAPGFLRELQQAVWSVNRNLPLAKVQTLDEIHANSMAQTSFAMVLLTIAATVALLLGVVGVYGVMAYIATQRTREIGVRMALGGQIRDVQNMFLRHGLLLTGSGIALGLGGAMVLTRVMSALLFGVAPIDPITYAGVSVGLATVALLATYLPARRASHIDPVVALRAEI